MDAANSLLIIHHTPLAAAPLLSKRLVKPTKKYNSTE